MTDWDENASYSFLSSKYEKLPWSISIVRNPWDRMVSYWTYGLAFYKDPMWRDGKLPGGEIGKNLDFITRLFSQLNSFEDFCQMLHDIPKENRDMFYKERFNLKSPTYRYNFNTTYYDWINGVDYIIKYENFEQDFRKIRDMYNCNEDRLHLKKASHLRNHVDYRNYYNDNSKNLIAKIFEIDIDTYKYTF